MHRGSCKFLVRQVGVVANIRKQVAVGDTDGVESAPKLAVDLPTGADAMEERINRLGWVQSNQ